MLEAPTLGLDFVADDSRVGFRLQRLEVLNWGTFHARVWKIEPGGDNALLTGDTIYVANDRRWASFMYSFPNLVPLPPADVTVRAPSPPTIGFAGGAR